MTDNPAGGQGWQSGGGGLGGSAAPPGFGVPGVQPIDRLRMAYQRRNETDYIAKFWSALGWGILTFGIFYLYMFYQLIRRLKDHSGRRLDELDAANAYAWEVAGRRGLQEELRPNFERASAGIENLRRLGTELRDPGTWLIIYLVASWLTYIGGIVVFFLVYCGLDSELVKHDSAEGGIEAELSTIYGRLGQPIPQPDPARVKGPDNYAARIIVTIITFGIYGLWWTYNLMNEPNQHFEINWAWEDSLAQAAQALQ
jgi:amino acid transporter